MLKALQHSPCLALLILLNACQSIPDGRDPLYARGETVVELLSGRQGIVEDGHYSHFQRSWRYRVRFVASSTFTSYGYSHYGSSRAGDASNRGVVWLYGYELLPLPSFTETTPTSPASTGYTAPAAASKNKVPPSPNPARNSPPSANRPTPPNASVANKALEAES